MCAVLVSTLHTNTWSAPPWSPGGILDAVRERMIAFQHVPWSRDIRKVLCTARRPPRLNKLDDALADPAIDKTNDACM